MKISLISAYYKNELMTQDFLNNLKGKLPKNTEVILVNAGSKPIENPIITKRIDLSENHSFSNSFNAGLKEAIGDYICIINNDAFPQTKDWLTKLVTLATRSKAWITSPLNDKTDLEVYTLTNDYLEYYEFTFFPAVCWVISREAFEKIGLFDERFVGGNYEDNDYCERMHRLKGKLIVAKDVTINHLQSQTIQLLDNKNLMLENYQRFKDKYK